MTSMFTCMEVLELIFVEKKQVLLKASKENPVALDSSLPSLLMLASMGAQQPSQTLRLLLFVPQSCAEGHLGSQASEDLKTKAQNCSALVDTSTIPSQLRRK